MIPNPNRRACLLRAVSAAALITAGASAALAQEAADQVPPNPSNVPEATEPQQPVGPGATSNQPPSPEDVASGNVLEEITVTAERREQSLQDVPISATVFSANEIARRGIANIADIQQAAPSVAINTVNRSTFINIRGVGIAQSAPTSNPGIAYYVDGQLIPHEQFIGQSFFDIGSIEVLRGPQGTLTGQNSTGGAIYVRTPEPLFNDLSGYVEQTVANFDQYRTTAALNYGGENVAFRIAGIHDQRDSFTRNIGPSPSQPGSFNLDAMRVNLALASPGRRLRINVRGEVFDYRSDNIAVKNRGDQNPALRDPAQPAPDPRQVNSPFVIREDAISYLNQQGYRLSGELRYELVDGIELRALTSWQDGYTRDQTDGDRGTAPSVPANLPTSGANTARFPGRVSRAETIFETWINEVNLLSTGGGPIQWVVGAFSLSEDVPVTLLRDNRSTRDLVRSNSDIIAEARNTSESLFGQVNWFMTDQVELLAGARYSWDKQVYTRFALPGPPLASPFTSAAKSTELTGKLGANLHLSGGSLLYATASKGYKAGGVNLTPGSPNFAPETNVVYELGAKTELLDRHLRINGAVFHSDYQDIQLASLFQGLPQTQNAASGKAWGAELELTGQFSGFGFNVGIGYLDAEFAKGVCINNTNNPAGTRSLCPSTSPTSADEFVPKGRTLPLSPKWTVNAGVQYALSLGEGLTLTPRVQWSHISSQLGTPFPSPLTIVPERDVLDARLTLDIGERYRLEAYANNVTDETYIASQIQSSSSATGGYIYGAPRQYGVRGTVRF